jgi:hypothetical protein
MSCFKTYLSLLIGVMITLNAYPQKWYAASAGETIFSLGVVNTDSTSLSPVVRFSPVFNLQEQLHYDFNKQFGIYTGLGIRNVGLISHYDDQSGNTEKIKERAYGLGVPLAVKLGNLESGTGFAAGVEAEMMFAYKRKIKQGDHKDKISGWLNDNLNLFNPSVFAEIKFKKGQYFRFKYYLRDFLNYKGIELINGEIIPDYGPGSKLFYVAIGTVKLTKKITSPSAPSETENAYFRTREKPGLIKHAFSSEN